MRTTTSAASWRRTFVCALLALLAGLALGCSSSHMSPPSIVIVLIDELRKDVADLEMERVGSLAARGVVFEEMRAAAPWTYPSVVSLLSGFYPQQHGATARAGDTSLSHFHEDVPLLQRTLGAAGYRTAAFVTNPFLLEWNRLHEGFDAFFGHFIGNQGNHWGFRQAWVSPTMFADNVNRAIREHFDAGPPDSPEFTYVHYIDVHGPWEGSPFPPGYRRAVRYIDGKVAELHAYFLERYQGNLIFVVTSDHGRALGDDLQVGAGQPWRLNKRSVHDFNLRVPFAILPSARVPEGVRIRGAASLVDVVPTLLEWVGLEVDPRMPGASLYTTIQAGGTLDEERPIYARNFGFGAMNDGMVYRGRKYVRFFDMAGEEVVAKRVFRLAEDPREIVAVPEWSGAAEELLVEAAGDHGLRFEAEFRVMDPQTQEQLRALGYILAPDGSNMQLLGDPD